MTKVYWNKEPKSPFIAQEVPATILLSIRQSIILSRYSRTPGKNGSSWIFKFKRSLKCILLHNENKYGSIPIAHSNENERRIWHHSFGMVLEKIKYHEHQFE